MDNKELRVIKKPLELRAAKGDDGAVSFSGYVFEWGAESDDLGGFRETITKGAASAWLASPTKNLFAILDHSKEVRNVLGDMETGTLKLFEDDRGLGFVIQAGPTTGAQDAAVVVGRNRVGMSFAFICGKQQWETKPDGSRLRTISEFRELDDISIVVDAAYKSSDVTVARRSLEEAIELEKRAATETAKPDAPVLLVALLATLRAMQVFYHSAHWQASGANAYGTHLLFERLYLGVLDQIDTLGEKLVGLFGSGVVDASAIAAAVPGQIGSWAGDDNLARGIAAETALQASIRETYDTLKASDQLPAGLDDFLLSVADDHDTNLYLLTQAAKPAEEPTEPRSKPENEEMETRPSVEFLRRQLDQADMEFRCCGESPMSSERREEPTHDQLAYQAHRATERAMDAKFGTGAPSRALELNAAEAHAAAAKSAKQEKREAAQTFHEAASAMHQAASGDDYASDYLNGTSYRASAQKAEVERRDNPNHHADGKFHDGSPENILAAAQGKLLKAEKRHGTACEAFRSVVTEKGEEHDDAVAAKAKWQEARAAHQSAIEAADACMADVTTAHESRCAEHRAILADQKKKFASPEYANPAGATAAPVM